ncbi:DUF2249 domain-containing protein [Oscillatoria amoena NRMC-F 0135]|nr:DUF2249 domain-containing protein [Oscillatoria amoena NRMC-F 0135]MDL5053474.1 DUF2249 domain-containing protein [Oscillatoria laete-virens NRMC-F 0139]
MSISFIHFDVRPIIAASREPFPEIMAKVESLKKDQGLEIVAPFLPSPLIERLGAVGFKTRFEHASDGSWSVFFWKDPP